MFVTIVFIDFCCCKRGIYTVLLWKYFPNPQWEDLLIFSFSNSFLSTKLQIIRMFGGLSSF